LVFSPVPQALYPHFGDLYFGGSTLARLAAVERWISSWGSMVYGSVPASRLVSQVSSCLKMETVSTWTPKMRRKCSVTFPDSIGMAVAVLESGEKEETATCPS
jgi:hypothetical protein